MGERKYVRESTNAYCLWEREVIGMSEREGRRELLRNNVLECFQQFYLNRTEKREVLFMEGDEVEGALTAVSKLLWE